MIKILSDLGELEAIASRWDELASAFKSPLLRHEWFAACAETLVRPEDWLNVIVSYSGEKITGIAPLVLKRSVGERLEILGQDVLNEPAGFIFQDENALRRLITSVSETKRPYFFKRLPKDSPEAAGLSQIRSGKNFLNNSGGSPFLETKVSWDVFLAGMRSDDRNHFRRKQKLLEKEGRVDYEIITPDPKRVAEYLEEIFRVESAGWKGRMKTAMMFEERVKRFFESYTTKAANLGMLRFCFLRVNREAIAVQIAVEKSNRFWMLKIGYDEKWKKHSPGILLAHEMIKYSFEKGLEGVEFLGKDEPWIHRWTKNTHSNISLRNYPYSLKGMGALARDGARSILKKLSLAGK